MYAAFMPATRPCSSTKAPPELPGEMGASVWMRSTVDDAPGNVRPSAETMPCVTVFCNPSGLPIAMTNAPTGGSAASHVAVGRFARSACNTATSEYASAPRTRADALLPSANETEMRDAFAIT